MALGQNAQIIPAINVKDMADQYVRQNFQKLADYFAQQNQLINFKFFEVVFTKATTNYQLNHLLGYAPVDVILAQLTGAGSVSFNLGSSNETYLSISSTDECRVRFFVGKYWNLITSATQKSTDIMTFSNSATVATSSSAKAQKIVTAGTYKAQVTDGLILANCATGPISVILPAADLGDQSSIRVQKIDSTANVCTVIVNSTGAEFIRTVNNPSLALSAQWSGQTFYCVKPGWYY